MIIFQIIETIPNTIHKIAPLAPNRYKQSIMILNPSDILFNVNIQNTHFIHEKRALSGDKTLI